jgi:hypothetical protein
MFFSIHNLARALKIGPLVGVPVSVGFLFKDNSFGIRSYIPFFDKP